MSTIGGPDNDLHLASATSPTGCRRGAGVVRQVTAGVGAGYPFKLVSGNHESNGGNGNINNFSACLLHQLPGAVGTCGREYYVDVPQEPVLR